MSDVTFNQTAVRWPGSGSAVSSSTVPFGFYLGEISGSVESSSLVPGSFEYDCQKAASWAANRLGYPNIEIEMIDINFYACFEEAVNEYGAQVNQFNIRNNLINLQGMQSNEVRNASGRNVRASGLYTAINISKDYGSAIGVGGNVEIKKVGIPITASVQTYDLQELIGDLHEQGTRIEVRRVFHYRPPAFARIYDPFSMTGMSYSNILNEMGFAGYSPATQFLMTPIFEDLLRGQAIEFNDEIRKSGYSFGIANNKLKIFPVPTYDHTLYIEYVNEKELYGADAVFTSGSQYDVISDYSNAPYQNITYSKINDVGKQWIRKYFLALCKETLGRTLQKYSTVPIPNGEVTLDGGELRQEAASEKEFLMTQLRENLEATTRKSQLEIKADESEKMQQIMGRVPLMIYIG